VAVVGALAAETHARNRAYWSAEGLWRDTVSKRPNDARARVAYGEALAGAGRPADAEAQLRTGIRLAPDDPSAHVRLGAVLAQQRNYDAAVPEFQRALALRPGDVDANRFLGDLWRIKRQDSLAIRHYEAALVLLPEEAPLALELTAKLAAILADSGDLSVRNPSRALGLADRGVRLTAGRDPRMLEILSVAQAASGRFVEAAATSRAAAVLARGRGDLALVSALEYRASAYENVARQAAGPRR
jgi:tetratricopeptide (TPR) repeat protein